MKAKKIVNSTDEKNRVTPLFPPAQEKQRNKPTTPNGGREKERSQGHNPC